MPKNNDTIVRLKQETISVLNEINHLRTKEIVADKKFFAEMLKGTRGLFTTNKEVLFLAKFYLANRKKV